MRCRPFYTRRAPCGRVDRNLETIKWVDTLIAVAPRAGAWIETPPFRLLAVEFQVAPRAGAWIETVHTSLMVGLVARRPMLLVITARPEFQPPWLGQSNVTALGISRLTQRNVEAMIDRVVGNKLLPPSIRQDIIERTDGIPLFVEEMTKAVLEAGNEGEVVNNISN
jgi:hypothetical protein